MFAHVRNPNKSILVTGGAGFIGSHLVEKLLNLGNQVTVLDNLSSGRLENLSSYPRLEFVKGDIRDATLVKKLVGKSCMLFHLAEYIPNFEEGRPGHVVAFSMKDPFLDFDISARGTLNVLEAARQVHAKVVFASTAAVYGDGFEHPISEDTPTNPVSPYGASKLTAEVYCGLYNRIHQVPIVIARLFNVYGPKQRKYVMYDILSRLKRNPGNLSMLGTGQEKRDFVYVTDAVDGLVYLSNKEEAYGQTFNLGTGIPTSISQVVTDIVKLFGIDTNITYTGASWKGDIKVLVADITKLRRIGFEPKYTLMQGLKELILWHQQVHK